MSNSEKLKNTKPIGLPELGEPFLLTPGPLTTSYKTKTAMLCDWGSWDEDFRAMTKNIRGNMLALLGEAGAQYDCVPLQGSGTYLVEAMLGSFLASDSKALVLMNGAYGQRIADTLDYLGREYVVLDKGDYLPPRGDEIAAILENDSAITHVVAVHVETSSGILNPIEEISDAVEKAGRKLLIDSMSGFGALDLNSTTYEAFVTSSNKCFEGVPGFSFVIAKKSALEDAKGNSHSMALDIHAQWAHMNKTGQWRYTPPTHVVAAFAKALEQHELEGGIAGRYLRYKENCDVLVSGMRKLGFETLLDDSWLSPIIVTFFNPSDAAFDFSKFYDLLKQKGFIIYPGKLTVVDSFRIGCIGQMDADIMRSFVSVVADTLNEMGVSDARPPQLALDERAKLGGK